MSSTMPAGARPSASRSAVVDTRAPIATLPAIMTASVASQTPPTSHVREALFNMMAALPRAGRGVMVQELAPPPDASARPLRLGEPDVLAPGTLRALTALKRDRLSFAKVVEAGAGARG